MKYRKSKKAKSLESTTMDKVPPVIHEALNLPGQPLHTSTQTQMETRFGHDFSGVRVHTDPKAIESANSINALAYTQGNDIFFNEGEYKPGTLIGDTLIAHELAHVLQQDEGKSDLAIESGTILDDSHAEKEANSLTLSTIASYLGGASNAFSQIRQNVMPSIKSGLSLQRCARSERIPTPAYFGRYSRETLDIINSRMESGAALQNWVAFGQVIVSFEDPLSALHSAEAAEALRAIPGIVKARVRQDIELLIVMHENELNEQERVFWHTLLEEL